MTIDIYDHEIPDNTYDEYTVNFFDDAILTLVTAKPSLVDHWIFEIESIHRRKLNRLIVGLDCEWRPNFPTQTIDNPVATLQLCVGRRCLIYQILHSQYIPDSLKEFLNNTSYKFVGVGIGDDVAKLERDYNIGVARFVDLREEAIDVFGVRKELNNTGLKGLAQFVLRKEIEKPKGVTMSCWDKPRLTNGQVSYACIDAFVSFEIGRVLKLYACAKLIGYELK